MKRTKRTLKHQPRGAAGAQVTALWSAGTVLVLALSGCANLPTDLVAADTLNVERLDSPGARIGSLFVGDKNGALLVRGRLEKRHAGRGPIPGHLHIEVLGEDGAILGQEITRYYRQGGKSGTSRFSREFALSPGDVRIVRVIHHVREDKETDYDA